MAIGASAAGAGIIALGALGAPKLFNDLLTDQKVRARAREQRAWSERQDLPPTTAPWAGRLAASCHTQPRARTVWGPRLARIWSGCGGHCREKA